MIVDDDIKNESCLVNDVTISDLMGSKKGQRHVCWARHMVCKKLFEIYDNKVEVGLIISRHYSSVINSLEQHDILYDLSIGYKALYDIFNSRTK